MFKGPYKQQNVLDMILKCIWCCGSSFGDMKYPFIAITPRYTLTWNGCVCYGPFYGVEIDLLENY